ncbi:MAG: hypothetical protein ACJ79A_12830, partial [Gemmatimonadaceae bacterium]
LLVRRPASDRAVKKAYGFFLVAAESIFLAVSIFAADVSIFIAAESIFMPVSAAAAGAGAIAGAAVSVFGASLVLQAATSTAAAIRARRFM